MAVRADRLIAALAVVPAVGAGCSDAGQAFVYGAPVPGSDEP